MGCKSTEAEKAAISKLSHEVPYLIPGVSSAWVNHATRLESIKKARWKHSRDFPYLIPGVSSAGKFALFATKLSKMEQLQISRTRAKRQPMRVTE